MCKSHERYEKGMANIEAYYKIYLNARHFHTLKISCNNKRVTFLITKNKQSKCHNVKITVIIANFMSGKLILCYEYKSRCCENFPLR